MIMMFSKKSEKGEFYPHFVYKSYLSLYIFSYLIILILNSPTIFLLDLFP
jgi:hypothetical protein